MQPKTRIIILSEFFNELKEVEELIDSEEWKGLDKKYVKGFKDCIEVMTRKSMEISMECDFEENEIEKMEAISTSFH